MPAGIGLVEYGPLQGLVARLKAIRISAADGGPVTLSSVTGLPFWALALLLAALTVVWAAARRRQPVGGDPTSDRSLPLRR